MKRAKKRFGFKNEFEMDQVWIEVWLKDEKPGTIVTQARFGDGSWLTDGRLPEDHLDKMMPVVVSDLEDVPLYLEDLYDPVRYFAQWRLENNILECLPVSELIRHVNREWSSDRNREMYLARLEGEDVQRPE